MICIWQVGVNISQLYDGNMTGILFPHYWLSFAGNPLAYGPVMRTVDAWFVAKRNKLLSKQLSFHLIGIPNLCDATVMTALVHIIQE